MAGNLVLTFEIFNGGEFLRREEMSAESVTIGKGPQAGLRIDNDALRELHAVLNVQDDGAVQLLDLAGDGSITVNGAPSASAMIGNGDTLGFGPVRVVVRLTDAGAFADDVATRVGDAKAAPMSLEKPAAAPATAAATVAADPLADDDESVEDVMAFVMRAAAANDAAADRTRGLMLAVSQVFGDSIVGVKHFPRGKRVTLGAGTKSQWSLVGPVNDWKSDFFVPVDMLPQDDFPIFENVGGTWVCNASERWVGFVDTDEVRKTFADMVAEGSARRNGQLIQVPIGDKSRLVIDLGYTVFVANQIYPGKQIVSKFAENIDYPFLGIIAFMTFVAVMFGVAVAFSPPPPDSSRQDIEDRMVELLLEKKEEEQQKDKKSPDKNPDAGEGAKAKKEEGKVGKKDAKMDKAKGDKVQMQKQQLDKEIAENAGLLGALRDDSALDGVLGNTGLNADAMNGIGGLIGSKGTQIGSGGLGARGSGLGGGGTAEGLGGLGTKGRGSGASGYGKGGGEFGAKGEGGIGTVGGDAIILGALDKSLIDAVIKRNMAQIRYCYQRELTKNPSLGGKITVKFVIAKDGTVSSATTKASTMNNPAVESCINGRFMRFQFPEPKGGGIVIVSYPFIFAPA